MVDRAITVSLCGDVMLGRGVDQVLPRPGDPTLRESYVKDARRYVELAELVAGPVPRPVDYAWPWGEALEIDAAMAPDVRVLNLETSVTRSNEFASGKGIHYRMCPDNLPALQGGSPDVCSLANNHVLDFGQAGLIETLDTLHSKGLWTVGAGRDSTEAQHPAVIPVGDRRLLALAVGHPSSGVPLSWAATRVRPGVHVVRDLTETTAAHLAQLLDGVRREGDLGLVSMHWGSNWGYDVPPEHVRFAHALVERGVDIVHGHSSHHARPLEVYAGRLILYGCGDFINDYEGISGYEQFRDDLRPLYFAKVDSATGALLELRIAVLQARALRLRRASPRDVEWFAGTLSAESAKHGTALDVGSDGMLLVKGQA